MTVVSESDDSPATDAVASYEDAYGHLGLAHTETWDRAGGTILVELELTNNGATPMNNIRAIYAVDPDQDRFSSANTARTLDDVSDLSGDGTDDWAVSVGPTSGRTIGFGACDEHAAEMGHYSRWSSPRDADQAFTDHEGASYDDAMDIRHTDSSSLVAGASMTIQFLVVVAETEADAEADYLGALAMCDAVCDSDGDGFAADDATCGGADCDDDDATVYPGATETW